MNLQWIANHKFLFIYGIVVHLILLVMLIKPNWIVSIHQRLFGQPVSQITEFYYWMLGYQKIADGGVPAGSTLFFGDSITQGLYVGTLTEGAVNYGIGGDTTSGLLERLPQYTSVKQALKIVVAIGINDLLRGVEVDTVLANYRKIVSAIPEPIPVVISALQPVDERVLSNSKEMNVKIRALNAKLKIFTDSSRCFRFVDAGALLADGDGNLAAKYHVGDGLHLNAAGNAVWSAVLKIAVAK